MTAAIRGERVGRLIRRAAWAALIAGGMMPAPGRAAEIPRYVLGPVSGYVYGCEEAHQKAPRPQDYVSSTDLDGDGQQDFVIDSGKGCAANRDLYCNAEGCTINIYVSSLSGLAGSFKAKSFRFARHGGKPALVVTRGGEACGAAAGQTCTATYVFDGEEMVAVP